MKTYIKNTEERKTIVTRIAELTGQKLIYTKTPRYTYEGQGFIVTRDGDLLANETADATVIAALVEEGLILASESALEGAQKAQEEAQGATAEETVEEMVEEPLVAQEAATEPQEAQEKAQDAVTEEVVEEPQEEAQEEETSADALTISFPLEGHTTNSLRNLVIMIYSRGALLSKATGGTFSCSMEQVTALQDCLTVSELVTDLTDALHGIVIADGKITFTGYPFTTDSEKIQAFTQLAAQMNKAAKEQKRVMAKAVDVSNERYIFRVWLLALGMAGDEFKTARRILLASLSGNAAFKDQAMEDRWKEKQAAKRKNMKEAK